MEGIRHWTKMAEEKGNGGGRPSGGKAEGEDDVVRRTGCGSKPVSGRAKKEDEARRNNQLTYGSRAAFEVEDSCSSGARSRDRPPGRRRRATAVLATARVTTLGSCGGGGGAQRQTQRRNDAWRRRRAVISRVMPTVNLGLAPSWRFCWRCRSGAILGTLCVRPFNFTA